MYVSQGAPTYTVTTPPAEAPVSLDELKTWLGIPAATTAFDPVLNLIIPAVTKNAERYTKRDFIAKTYTTLRDGFYEDIPGVYEYPRYPSIYSFDHNDNPLQLRRTPTTSIVSINYLNIDEVVTLVDSSVYYLTQTSGSDFSLVLPVDQWPNDVLRDRLQTVTIEFVAGWADAAAFQEQWNDLYLAMLTHMAYAFTNRGDCSVAQGCQCASAPAEALMVYGQYLIPDMVV